MITDLTARNMTTKELAELLRYSDDPAVRELANRVIEQIEDRQ